MDYSRTKQVHPTTLTTTIKNFKDEFPNIRNWDRTVTTVTSDVFHNLKKKYNTQRLSAQELEEKAQARRAASRWADDVYFSEEDTTDDEELVQGGKKGLRVKKPTWRSKRWRFVASKAFFYANHQDIPPNTPQWAVRPQPSSSTLPSSSSSAVAVTRAASPSPSPSSPSPPPPPAQHHDAIYFKHRVLFFSLSLVATDGKKKKYL
ncbi:hypothetical protein BDA99DRAFT_566793 [Phascolomyces articulosus]|uniref:Uncharacterized protein n=1 Tax=Phascolomyces articulosus TaxID=60185 RepID=A0AAD5JWK4_9FUNG|nr:hypothetical protein BDA99DRAFT_566793 [Phascolomyces articulosus]